MTKPYGLSPEAAATLAGCHVKTIYRWLDEGRFPLAKKAGRSWLIPESDILAFMDRCTDSVFPR